MRNNMQQLEREMKSKEIKYESEIRRMQEKIDSMKEHEEILQDDKKNLRNNLKVSNDRANKLEQSLISREGEIEQLKLAHYDKETQMKQKENKLENDNRILQKTLEESKDKANKLDLSLRSQKEKLQHLTLALENMKQNEKKYENDKKNLRTDLRDVNSKANQLKISLSDREEENRRLREDLDDKETNIQILEDRVNSLMKQKQYLQQTRFLAKTEDDRQKDRVLSMNPSLANCITTSDNLEDCMSHQQKDFTNSEHNTRISNEKLETTREILNKAKEENHYLMGYLQSIQNDISDNKFKRQSHGMFVHSQEANQEMNQSIHQPTFDRKSKQERKTSLSRSLANLGIEACEIEISHDRLEKYNRALEERLHKAEKMTSNEVASRVAMLEDNLNLRKLLQHHQALQAEAEQKNAQRLMSLEEMKTTTDRLKSALMLAETREQIQRGKVGRLEAYMRTRRQYSSLSNIGPYMATPDAFTMDF